MATRKHQRGGGKSNFVDEVVDTLIKRMKEGTSPFQKPWNPDASSPLPMNPTTGNRYKGINSIMLYCQMREDPRWMTFKQAKDNDWYVKKGESGTRIQYWKTHENRVVRDEKGKPILDKEGNKQKIRIKLERPRVFYATVFNAEQIEGIPSIEKKEITWDPNQEAEKILKNSGAVIENSNDDRAYYASLQDIIRLPKKEQFDTAGDYYGVALHELGHWTGHESRLDRDILNPFGSQEYAKEELRAEIASMILGQELNIGRNLDHNVAYIQNWISVLENDPLELFRAATDAEKIFDLVLSYQNERVQEHELPEQEEGKSMYIDKINANDTPITKVDEPLSNSMSLPDKANDNERIYINVPYKEKNEAKSLGAKWDRKEKSWYFIGNDRTSDFAKWDKQTPQEQREQKKQISSTSKTKDEEERRYLAVPYGERLAAKNLGAKWDAKEKSWYVPQSIFDADGQKFSRWSNLGNDQNPPMDPREEFKQTLIDMGCNPDSPTNRVDHPVMDGSKQRIAVVDDKPGEMSGFYIAHSDGHPAGYIKNHRTNTEIKWKSKGYSLSEAEKANLNAVAAQKKKERVIKEQKEHEATAVRVSAQLKTLKQVEEPTPYMVAKGIEVHKGTFTDQKNKTTYLPIVDIEGKQWSMAYIKEDGTKRYAKEGKKEGCFHAVGNGFKTLKDAPALVFSEGYSTAAAVTQALGYTTVAVFDSGNLPTVAKQFREKYPDKPIVICGDDDLAVKEKLGVNPGRSKAEEAARAVGGEAIFPIFAPGEQSKKNKDFTDFNDLAQKSVLGKEGVKNQVKTIVDFSIKKEREKKLQQQQEQKKIQQKQKAKMRR